MLKLEGLSAGYHRLQILHELDLRVDEGELVAIVGANGAGKTTMFNLVAGALRPDTGRVHLGGKEITGHAPHRITAAGMTRTFQLMRPFYSMTVLENVTVAVLARPWLSVTVSFAA